MPIVPTINRQVQTAAAPNVQLQYQSFNPGAGLAKGLQSVAQVAQQIGEKEKQDADRLMIQEAINEIDMFEQSLYDPKSGIFTRKGRDALKLQDEVGESYQKLTGGIYSRLNNDQQRMAFNELKQARQNQIIGAVQKYELREYERYADETDFATVALSQQLASEHFDDPQRIDSEVQKVVLTTLSAAQRKGWGAERTQLEMRQQVSALHVGVLTRMVEASPVAAKAYYEANKDEIFGSDEARAINIFDTKAKVYEAEQYADTIISGNSEQKLSVWLEASAGIEDPEVKRETRNILKARFNDIKVAQDELAEEAFKQVENGVDPRKQDWYLQVTPQVRAALDSRWRQVREGIEPVNNDAIYLRLIDMDQKSLANMTPAEIEIFRPELDDSHWSRVNSLWQAARSAARSPKDAAKFNGLQSTKDRIYSAATLTGFIDAGDKVSDLSGAAAMRYMQFTDNIERLMEVETFAKGSPLTATEEQKIIDREVRTIVFVDEWGTDPQIPAIASLPGEDVYVPIAKVPAQFILEARRTIESNNWNRGSVERRIQRAYAAALRGDRETAEQLLKGDN